MYASRKRAGGPPNGHALTPALSRGEREPPTLPTGVIVGTAVISHVTNGGAGQMAYEWHLANVHRIKHPRKPKRMPQPVWFRPF